MKQLTMAQASKLPFAPSRAYLSQTWKRPNPPGYFIYQGDNSPPLIDVDHDDWLEMIERRGGESLRLVGRGGPVLKPEKKKAKKINLPEPDDGEHDDNEELRDEAIRAKLMEPILKNQVLQHKVELNKIELEKEAGHLIEFQLAEFLFFGYLERLHIDLLGMMKKIAPIIDNLVKEQKPEEVIRRVQREIETVLTEIKTAQKKDVEKWKHEK